MSALQKFMFDNFTIEVKDDKKKIVPIDFSIEDDIVEIPEEIEEERIISPIVTEKTYTQKELDEFVNKARQEATEVAKKEAIDNNAKAQNDLMTMLDNKLNELLKEGDNSQEEQYKNNVCKLGEMIIQKLVPTLQQEQGQKIVEKFLQDNFNNFKVEKKLIIHLNPANVSAISAVIAKLAEKNDFEGKISIVKDDALSVADCKVLWDFGGCSIEQDKNIKAIEEIIKS